MESQDYEQDDKLTAEETPEQIQQKWVKELEAARNERKSFDAVGVNAIRRFGDQRNDDTRNRSRYNLFYANTEIKKAAVISCVPEPDIRRKYRDAHDDASRVAGTIGQRSLAAENELDDFETKFDQMLFDWMAPGIGIGWVSIDQVVSNEDDGDITDQMTHIDYVSWADFLWSPCQVWTDCRWVARRVPMTKKAVQKRFPEFAEECLQDLSFEPIKSDSSSRMATDELRPKNNTQKTTDVYEIWCRETETVYWVAEGCEKPLGVSKDTNDFPGFFPTPLPPLGRFTTASTIPRSDYVLTQDLYDQLDSLQQRGHDLIQCLKARFVYDAARPEIANLFSMVKENHGIPVQDFQVWVSEKGGIANAIQFVPIEQFAIVLAQINDEIQKVKRDIFDIEGIADYMRGETQQYDSAAAINQKGSFAGNRLGARQKQTAKYVEKLYKLKFHLMSKFYKPEILVERAGALPPADMQHIGEAVKLLKSNVAANFRLSVSVDSLQDKSWNVETKDRSILVQHIGGLIAQSVPAVQQTPELAPLIVELIRFAVAGHKGSEEIEGLLDDSLNKLLAASAQGGQKPPDKEQIKAQAQAARDQTNLQIAQMEKEAKIIDSQIDAQAVAAKVAQDDRKLQLEEAKVRADITMKALENAHWQANEMAQVGK